MVGRSTGGRDPNHSDKRNLIIDEFRDKPTRDIIEEYRSLLNMTVYIRWFNRKAPEARQRLLKTRRRLSYSESEAQEIVPLLGEYCNDSELVSAYLYFVAHAFTALGKPQYAELLMNERRKQKRDAKDTQPLDFF